MSRGVPTIIITVSAWEILEESVEAKKVFPKFRLIAESSKSS